jgi:tRNA nucleotidyltransferase/poly(A) polymerase
VETPALHPSVRAALARLHAAGIRGWVVGGALRDLLLGLDARDVDVVVDAPLERAAAAIPGSIRIDAAVPMVLLRGSPRIELTAFRGGARDIAGDLRLRDFTLNAIALDPGGTLVDPTGGRDDLRERRLRATEPRRAFRDDPLRVMRGARLVAELELSIDPSTRDAMQRESWRLAECAGERIREELFRALELESVERALRELRISGALAVVLPELLRTVGVAQNAHHSDDVYTHTMRVCELCPARAELRLAALLHDCAKPEAKRFSEKKADFTFHRHDVEARAAVSRAAARLRLSRASADRVSRLVRHHLLFPDQLQTDAALRRMLRRVGADLIDDLLELRTADYASRSRELPKDWLDTEARIRATAQVPALAVGGADVIRETGLQAGPEVGRWLRRLTERVIADPTENERERLLGWLRKAREERRAARQKGARSRDGTQGSDEEES